VAPAPNKKLEAAGLKQSQIDDCVYTYKRLIYILYTDDSILIGPDEQELVKITNRILQDLCLNGDQVATKGTPAKTSDILRRGTHESPEFNGSFNYCSVIGKMNYIQTTWMDIAHAVHQCARFAAELKDHHGKAVRWIGRYLAATRDKGITYKPVNENFNVYVDADFAGNWSKDSLRRRFQPDTSSPMQDARFTGAQGS
jgi:hypothetical protein